MLKEMELYSRSNDLHSNNLGGTTDEEIQIINLPYSAQRQEDLMPENQEELYSQRQS